jgi:two-component system, NarL family, response regulator DegU
MEPVKTRVVLADDHARVRAGIRSLLEKTHDIIVVGEAVNGVEALRLVEALSPDVLLLDVEMPLMNGNEVAARLQKKSSPVRILALSAHDDSQYILGMLRNGVAGYLMKEEVPETLVRAVRGVAKGEQGWMSRRVAQIVETRAKNERRNQKTFTAREMDILKLLSSGISNEEIASKLGINIGTVERHIEMLCGKLDALDRNDLIGMALKAGLVK